MEAPQLLVSSPMRCGSTWVHGVLTSLLAPAHTDFVATADEVSALTAGGRSCVLKSHSIVYPELFQLPPAVQTIRVLRNFKDSLISRALYCRNVRPAEGLPNEPLEDEIIQSCQGLPDEDYVREALRCAPLAGRWLQHLVSFEPGAYSHTFYYEMLLHNARAEFQRWLSQANLNPALTPAHLDAALSACSFLRLRASTTKGFVGSTGVGRWMHILDEKLSSSLEELYQAMPR